MPRFIELFINGFIWMYEMALVVIGGTFALIIILAFFGLMVFGSIWTWRWFRAWIYKPAK